VLKKKDGERASLSRQSVGVSLGCRWLTEPERPLVLMQTKLARNHRVTKLLIVNKSNERSRKGPETASPLAFIRSKTFGYCKNANNAVISPEPWRVLLSRWTYQSFIWIRLFLNTPIH
jgi:hypothetical protein